jgi:glycosyltransferase involved in cell wall biosynthesis
MTDDPVLVVFSDDWGRHPSSCQHLVRKLLPKHEVIWIDTIGTRPIRFDFYTLRRGISKVVQWSNPKKKWNELGERSPTVCKPMMWPSFQSRFARALNRRLLSRCLLRELRGRVAIFLTTIPVVADLVGVTPAERWVYYCVDDFGVWPGLDGTTLRSMETELVSKVDRLAVVSETLQRRLGEMGRPSMLLTHGVDLENWENPTPSTSRIDGLASPIILFWGLIDARLNVDWIAKLSDSISTGSIILIGPTQNFDPRLASLSRVSLLGPVDFSELPMLAAKANVLIMPYADLPVTRAMQPLKFKEYLATGKPVVATRLPAIAEWNDAADLVDDAGEFVAFVERRIKNGVDEGQSLARRRLEPETWAAKAKVLERLCFEQSP